MDRVFPMIQGTMALADGFQLPLIIAIVFAVKLTRRWGRAWKGIGVAFGAYACWVVVTARFVGFSPSGYLVLILGSVLDPFSPTWHPTSTARLWGIGIGAAVVLVWLLPTGIAFVFRRRRVATPRPVPHRPPAVPLVWALVLLAAQQMLFAYADRLDRDGAASGKLPLDAGGWRARSIALAVTLPILVLAVTALVRWVGGRRRRHARVDAQGGP